MSNPLLYPFSLAYGLVTGIRNRLYDSGRFASVEFSFPVISIGNLSAGGTGKTPHTAYLAQLLLPEYRVAVMSRGYKRKTCGFILADAQSDAATIGDEPRQLQLRYPELTVSVAEDRLTGIPALLHHRPDTQVILLDDAFQHRAVRPGINIMLTDYAHPFYKDHILPYGRLREARSGAKRADIIIVTKCPPDISGAEMESVRKAVNPAPAQQVFFSTLRYGSPYGLVSGDRASFAGKSVLLVSGIANPAPLLRHLGKEAANVTHVRFPDHHYFSVKDLERIRSAYDQLPGAKRIVTTEKDAVRLTLHGAALQDMLPDITVLPVDVELCSGAEAFHAILHGYIRNTLAAVG